MCLKRRRAIADGHLTVRHRRQRMAVGLLGGPHRSIHVVHSPILLL
jgi:hypothetical protein